MGASVHEHKLQKFYFEEPEVKKEKTLEDKLKEKIEEKINYQYTDIVGDIPIKFKYTKVKNDDFGLTDDMLLYLDDKTINKYVPMKTLAPYREEEYKINKFKLKKEERLLSKEIAKKKENIDKELHEEDENIKMNQKFLGNKKENKFIEKNNERNKRRMELYGIGEEKENKINKDKVAKEKKKMNN